MEKLQTSSAKMEEAEKEYKDKEEDVNEDICRGDDDDDQGTDANIVRNTLQQALVFLRLRIILRKHDVQFSETNQYKFQNQRNALSARFEK